jgi:acyl carrier protein
MNTKTEYALTLVREALANYTDTPASDIHLDTTLADLQVDSLTLAELLFELEDHLGTTISDVVQAPKQISDIIALIEPFIGDKGIENAA